MTESNYKIGEIIKQARLMIICQPRLIEKGLKIIAIFFTFIKIINNLLTYKK